MFWTNPSEEVVLEDLLFTFNFSNDNGIVLSDVVGIYLSFETNPDEWRADVITRTFVVVDVDIFDVNEVPLSCRDVAFACVEPDSPFVDEILAYDSDGNGGNFEGINGANTASFEYGINNAIPHSRNGELLCPGNIIEDGIVKLQGQGIAFPESFTNTMFLNIYVGLNNGNGRGSMDSVWWENRVFDLE